VILVTHFTYLIANPLRSFFCVRKSFLCSQNKTSLPSPLRRTIPQTLFQQKRVNSTPPQSWPPFGYFHTPLYEGSDLSCAFPISCPLLTLESPLPFLLVPPPSCPLFPLKRPCSPPFARFYSPPFSFFFLYSPGPLIWDVASVSPCFFRSSCPAEYPPPSQNLR